MPGGENMSAHPSGEVRYFTVRESVGCRRFLTTTCFVVHGPKPCGNSETRSPFGWLTRWRKAFWRGWRDRRNTSTTRWTKRNLGVSVADALLERPVLPLPPGDSFAGTGIYAIYYTGKFKPYRAIAERNRENKFVVPIYVGKAVPAGARNGGFGLGIAPGQVLFSRLREHADSIGEAENLSIEDFQCRYLVVDDISDSAG